MIAAQDIRFEPVSDRQGLRGAGSQAFQSHLEHGGLGFSAHDRFDVGGRLDGGDDRAGAGDQTLRGLGKFDRDWWRRTARPLRISRVARVSFS